MAVRGSLETPPMVIVTSPLKTALSLLGSIAFVAIGAVLLQADGGDRAAVAWVAILFFGLIGVLAVAKLFRPDRLELSPAGLRYITFLGLVVDTPWAEVGPFEIWSHRNAKLVMFSVSDRLKAQVRFQGLNAGMTGQDVCLPGGWPMGGQKLANLLNDARTLWG